jgi:hypothetical protein
MCVRLRFAQTDQATTATQLATRSIAVVHMMRKYNAKYVKFMLDLSLFSYYTQI